MAIQRVKPLAEWSDLIRDLIRIRSGSDPVSGRADRIDVRVSMRRNACRDERNRGQADSDCRVFARGARR
jgi:hypothetical protein